MYIVRRLSHSKASEGCRPVEAAIQKSESAEADPDYRRLFAKQLGYDEDDDRAAKAAARKKVNQRVACGCEGKDEVHIFRVPGLGSVTSILSPLDGLGSP